MTSTQVKEILKNATIDGNKLFLNCPQLDRTLYQEVDKVLKSLGGQWKGGKTKAHVFDPDSNPQIILSTFLESGDSPNLNPFAFFATKTHVAEQMVGLIDKKKATKILEPSAGTGAIANVLRATFPDTQIDLIEIDKNRAATLTNKNLGTVLQKDFLIHDEKYPVIAMNPPFALEEDSKAYITHITHAWTLLEDGGQLIAIAPMGFTFSTDKRSKMFLSFVSQNGYWDELPEDSFEGTRVRAALCYLEK